MRRWGGGGGDGRRNFPSLTNLFTAKKKCKTALPPKSCKLGLIFIFEMNFSNEIFTIVKEEKKRRKKIQ